MSERDIGFYVEDMLEFAQHALEYARGLTEATLTQYCSVRRKTHPTDLSGTRAVSGPPLA